MSGSAISWIISICFVLILVAGFFVGFWRGWKRSVFNLICSVIGIIVAIFVTKPITNAIMGIEITANGAKTTLNGLLVGELEKIDDVNLMMNANDNFRQFINGLPSALANAVVFIVVTALISSIVYVIYKIACIWVKYRPEQKKHRNIGGGVNALKVFILMVLAMMPLTSLVGMLGDMADRESYIVETQEIVTLAEEGEEGSQDEANEYGYIGQVLPNDVITIIKGYNNSLFGKICGIGGMDDNMLDYFADVKVDDTSVKVRQEVLSYYEVLAFKYDVEHATNLKFTNINYEKLGIVIDKVVESPLFTKVVSQTLADMVINYEDYSFMAGLKDEWGSVLDRMGESLTSLEDKSEYFSQDLKRIVGIFEVLGENGVIDDISSLETKDIDSILEMLTDTSVKEGKLTNKQSFDSGVQSLFKMNTIRDCIAEILKKYSAQLIDGLDEVGVDTSTWSEEDWSQSATSICDFVSQYSGLTKQIDLSSILTDATIILDKDKDYDIEGIMTSLGGLLDSATGNRLLSTSAGKSIFLTLLENNNITLPDGEIKDAGGNVKNISSYTQLFTFLSPSFEKLKTSGMYEVINNGENTVKSIAEILAIKEEGKLVNKDLLKEIILPLSQVQPTKTLMMDSLTSSLGGGILDLSTLVTYDDWNRDLGYISDLLIILNDTKLPDGVTSYLDKVIGSKTDEMFDSLTQSQVDGIVKPILYSKSTKTLREEIITNIVNACNDITGKNDSVSLEAVTLIEGDKEDQGDEICEIIKALIPLRGETGDLKDMDEDNVKNLLSALQENGYRCKINSALSQEGAFKGIFDSVMDKLKGELSDLDEACQLKYSKTTVEKLEELCGSEGYLQASNYGEIDFAKVFEKLNSLKSELED